MKKNTKTTIALAAAALLLSGASALAADVTDVAQNDTGHTARGVSASTNTQQGAVIDLDQNGEPGGGHRRVLLRKPRIDSDPEDKSGRFVNQICLVTPIMGQMICF